MKVMAEQLQMMQLHEEMYLGQDLGLRGQPGQLGRGVEVLLAQHVHGAHLHEGAADFGTQVAVALLNRLDDRDVVQHRKLAQVGDLCAHLEQLPSQQLRASAHLGLHRQPTVSTQCCSYTAYCADPCFECAGLGCFFKSG